MPEIVFPATNHTKSGEEFKKAVADQKIDPPRDALDLTHEAKYAKLRVFTTENGFDGSMDGERQMLPLVPRNPLVKKFLAALLFVALAGPAFAAPSDPADFAGKIGCLRPCGTRRCMRHDSVIPQSRKTTNHRATALR